MTVIVTGAAGFIGAAVCDRLLSRGDRVVGVDTFNAYYDPALKRARVARLQDRPGFRRVEADVADAEAMAALVADPDVTGVVHLAAQAGVRYSIDNPFAYQHSNLAGHLSVLEACRHAPSVRHLVYASSSSVYGNREGSGAFSEDDPTDHPVSLYAATKRSGELISQSYASLYGFPMSGLRFFTVYGPWGRPDMAYFSFTRKILAGEPIEVFGQGRMARDFTYIDDIVDGVVGVLDRPGPAGSHRLFNIGDNRPIGLMRMFELLETALGRKAEYRFEPMQAGDVEKTYADIDASRRDLGFEPRVPISEGIPRFVKWYQDYYRIWPSN